MPTLDKNISQKILIDLDDKGFLFSNYKLVKENESLCLLGSGGFSEVYEMQDVNNPDKKYAIKVIGMSKHTVTSEVFNKTTRVQRMLDELTGCVVRIIADKELCIFLDKNGNLSSVTEPNDERWNLEGYILQFILMEKLSSIIDKDKFKKVYLLREELSKEEEMLKLMSDIGKVLLIAHNNNILHRDIKLENIFWDEDTKCYKLGDFEMCKETQFLEAETVTYTDGYGAPEIEMQLDKNYNNTADIYSFGITMYLLFNDLKFPASEGYYVNMMQYNENFIAPAPRNAPPKLARIIGKMCAYRQNERYQSVRDIFTDMYELQAEGEEEYINLEVLEDLATETYRDTVSLVKDSKETSSNKKTRMQKKLEEKKLRRKNNIINAISMLICSGLTILLLTAWQSNNIEILSWRLWILPYMTLLLAVLQRIKEFQYIYSVLLLGFNIFAIFKDGIMPIHILIFTSILGWASPYSMGIAIGTFVWTWLVEKDCVVCGSFNSFVKWMVTIVFGIIAFFIMISERGKNIEKQVD